MNEKLRKILYIVLSCLLAIVFWLYVDTEEGNTITRTFSNISVEFIGAEDVLPSRGLMLTDGKDATVDLQLKGPRMVLTSLRRSDIRLQVDLTDISASGSYSRSYTPVYADEIDSSSIKVDRASRSAVTVRVDPLATKTIPVQLQILGSPADGYICKSDLKSFDPVSITVSGRDEDIDPVENAVVTVNMAEASATVNQEFSFQLQDSSGNVVENDAILVSTKRIAVMVPVYMTKELDLTVTFHESPGSRLQDVETSLDINTVTVAGEPASLEGRDNIILADIYLDDYVMDMESIPLEIPIPAGCENLSGETTATLSLKFKDDLETRAFTVTNITGTGCDEGQYFYPITKSIEVLVRGPTEDVEQLTAEDIRAVVDVTQYTTNTTASEPATILVDRFDNVGAVGSYTVAFRITSQAPETETNTGEEETG